MLQHCWLDGMKHIWPFESVLFIFVVFVEPDNLIVSKNAVKMYVMVVNC